MKFVLEGWKYVYEATNEKNLRWTTMGGGIEQLLLLPRGRALGFKLMTWIL